MAESSPTPKTQSDIADEIQAHAEQVEILQQALEEPSPESLEAEVLEAKCALESKSAPDAECSLESVQQADLLDSPQAVSLEQELVPEVLDAVDEDLAEEPEALATTDSAEELVEAEAVEAESEVEGQEVAVPQNAAAEVEQAQVAGSNDETLVEDFEASDEPVEQVETLRLVEQEVLEQPSCTNETTDEPIELSIEEEVAQADDEPNELAAELRVVEPVPDADESQEEDALEDQFADEEADSSSDSPGGLLRELERRQDEVLERLDQLNARIESVLLELGVRLDDEADVA